MAKKHKPLCTLPPAPKDGKHTKEALVEVFLREMRDELHIVHGFRKFEDPLNEHIQTSYVINVANEDDAIDPDETQQSA